jgi:hypothetical protein
MAAISMLGVLAVMISGAWLLIMGISDRRPNGWNDGPGRAS